MAGIDPKDMSKQQIKQAMECKTADELLAFAQAEGIDLDKEQAEAYLAEMAGVDLSDEQLESVAGGCWDLCVRPGCINN